MKSLKQGELSIDVQTTPAIMLVSWLGRSDERDPSATLGPFFGDLRGDMHADLEVVLDFRELDYMNSSTVRPIVTFLKDASDASRNVCVMFDGSKGWQKLSFRALQSLATVFKNVRFQG